MTAPIVIECTPGHFMALVADIQLPPTENLQDLAASIEAQTWDDETYCFLHRARETTAEMIERHLQVRLTLRSERHRLRWADFEPPY